MVTEVAKTPNIFSPSIETKTLLKDLLLNPEDYQNIMETFTARNISSLAWGNANHSSALRSDTQGLLEAISPSGAISNKLPFLMKIPRWFAPWKVKERRRQRTEQSFFTASQREVGDKLERGEAGQSCSFTKVFLENRAKGGAHEEISEEEGAFVVGQMAIAGALTMSSPLQTYILAMCLYPKWQLRVQEEIDRVVGDRMPELGDSPEMPVLRAVIKECMRWRPPVPTGMLLALCFATF